MCVSLFDCTLYFTGPSSPPQNVTSFAVNSTSIFVFWDPPPFDDQNGVITGYRVNISNLNQINISIDVPDIFFTAVDLEEFEVYDIQVAAMTAIGLGPFSGIIRSQTFEDG